MLNAKQIRARRSRKSGAWVVALAVAILLVAVGAITFGQPTGWHAGAPLRTLGGGADAAEGAHEVATKPPISPLVPEEWRIRMEASM